MKKLSASGQKKASPMSAANSAGTGGNAKKKQLSANLLAAKKRAQQVKKATAEVLIDDPYQVAEESKEVQRGPTAMITEPRMQEHLCLWDQTYPECPERLTQTLKRCQELGLLSRCLPLSPCAAEENDILSVHTQELFNLLKNTSGCNDNDELERLSSDYDAIYIHPTTFELAKLAAGSAVSLVKAVCTGKAQNGMALIRPPGHHAMENEFCGYCFFNNAAVAARSALDNGWAKRILIVDWDVHHGQATQQAFYTDPRVLYFSIHRYENGTFWPNLEESNFNYIGADRGLGFNVNVPLNDIGMGDADYLAIFQHVLLPIAQEFQPDLTLISAGYDAAVGCPEFAPDLVLISSGYDSALGDEKGEMQVTPACYMHLTNLLSVLAGGKMAVLLEGGYCLRSLAESAALTLKTLLGDPCPSLGNLPPPCDSVLDSILNTMYALRPYWEVFKHLPTVCDKEVNLKLKTHLPKVDYLGPSVPATKPFATRDCYPVQSSSFIDNVNKMLTSLIEGYNMNVPAHRVGLVYHDGMLAHCNEKEPGHVESPQRASGIFAKHEEFNLLQRCFRLEARRVTDEELLSVHSPSHVALIRGTSGKSSQLLSDLAESFNSIYLHPSSFDCAELSAGCVIQAVDSVLKGDCLSSVAIVRPPGHHAEQNKPCGFCLFNNVAIAANYAIDKFKLQRILILDWDVHHGNGTQQIFQDDPRVMYMSLHRYDNGTFFPATINSTAAAEAAADFVGKGEGKGYSINVAWNKRGMGDSDYAAAFLQVILPIAYQFNPELVLISAGFDAAVRDPLGGCKVSPQMYCQMTRWLQGLAGGRVVLALEGGYNVSSISYSLTMCTKALLGDPVPTVNVAAPCPSAVNSIRNTQQAQAPYWSSLCLHTRAIPSKVGLIKLGSYGETNLVEDLADAMSAVQISDEKENMPEGAIECKDEPDSSNLQDSDQPTEAGSSGSGNQSTATNDQPGPSSSTDNVTSDIKTLKDFFAECMKSGEEMYALIPRSDCPHLEQIKPVPETGIDMASPCQSCDNTQENWVCLYCYTVHCGRFMNQHMEAHSIDNLHPLVLSQADLSVWCYGCDTYVDAPALYEAKNSAHRIKFGDDMPWTYDAPFTLQMSEN